MSMYRIFLAILFPFLVIAVSIGTALPESNGKLKASARAGDPQAQYELARIYFEGIGEQQNITKVVEWVTRASDNGEPHAQLALCMLYLDGQGVEQNPEKGIDLIRAAAEQDLADAQGVMAMAYGRGIVVQQDPDQFLHWVKRAAKNGDPGSQFNMGILHLTGQLLDKSPDEARYWLTKSANANFLEAQVTLGEVLMAGLDQEPNLVAACKWFAIAGSQGHGKGNQLLMQVTQEMSREQMDEAARQANQWLDKRMGQ